MYLNSKIFRKSMHGLFIHEKSLKRVKDLISDSNISTTTNWVVFMPILKSVVDIMVLSYIYMHQDMEIPFTFGNEEEVP